MRKSRVCSEDKIKGPRQLGPLKNCRLGTVEYIWPSSIPYSWDRIMTKHNISRVKIKKSNRSTLGFLEETQKYINRICNPEVSEPKIVVRSKKKSLALPLLAKPVSLSPDPGAPLKFESFGSQFIKNKLAVLRTLRKSPDLPNNTNSPAHKQNHSCGSLFISFKKYS